MIVSFEGVREVGSERGVLSDGAFSLYGESKRKSECVQRERR